MNDMHGEIYCQAEEMLRQAGWSLSTRCRPDPSGRGEYWTCSATRGGETLAEEFYLTAHDVRSAVHSEVLRESKR